MKENLDKISQISEEEVRAIRHYKLQEIQRAWSDLFAIEIIPLMYKKHPEYMDYKTFEHGFRKKFETIWGNSQIVSAKIDPEIEEINSEKEVILGIKLKEIGEDELAFFDKVLSLNYIPPQDWKGIANHLLLLVSYYSNGNVFLPSIEMRVDLSLCKLIGAVNRLYGAAMVKGETREAGRKKQNKNVESSKTEVFEAFQSLGIKNNPRYKYKSQVANVIIKYLKSKNNKFPLEEQKKIPSEKTIIRYFESNDKIRRDLIEMGLIKDKPTLVQ